MKTRIALGILASVLTAFAGSSAVAQDEPAKKDVEPVKKDAEAAFKKYAAGRPGVYGVKKDKKGRILSCIVVGRARISTALGAAKGLEVAGDRANLAVSAEFIKWLKEDVSIHQQGQDETVMFMEGSEDNDADALKEAGKAVESTSTKIESISKGLVRGLQVLHTEVDGDGKTYTIVKGWNANTAKGVKKVVATQADDKPSGKAASKSSGKQPATTTKKIDKEIESGSITADEAADFLP